MYKSHLPICEAYFAAAAELGIPRNDDMTGENQEGAGYYQLTQRWFRRSSAATAFLKPALKRPNLTLKTGAQVLRMADDETNQATLDIFRGVAVNAEDPASVQVEVLNGSGTSGQADTVNDDLSGVGFTVIGTGDAERFDFATTVVRYTPGNEASADLVRRYLVAGAQLEEVADLPAPVVVVTGLDYAGVSAEPAPSDSTTTTSPPPPTEPSTTIPPQTAPPPPPPAALDTRLDPLDADDIARFVAFAENNIQQVVRFNVYWDDPIDEPDALSVQPEWEPGTGVLYARGACPDPPWFSGGVEILVRDLDTVAELSRSAANLLDAERDIDGAYVLEVSSPGVDRPLTSEKHFRRARGRNVEMALADGSQLTGRVGEICAGTVAVVGRSGRDWAVRSVALGDVVKAMVQVEFSPPPQRELELAGVDRNAETEGG